MIFTILLQHKWRTDYPLHKAALHKYFFFDIALNQWKDLAHYILYFLLIVKETHKHAKPNNELILSVVCVSKACLSLFLYSSKNIKNILI